MSIQPLLFYSNSCPYSLRIIKTLQDTPDADKVLRVVCVDYQIDKIPAEIHSVPALLVPTSSGNKVVFDMELYEWLNNILRIDNKAKESKQAVADASDSVEQQMPSSSSSGAPMEYMPSSDALLCDLAGAADSADHLFAGASENIHVMYQEDTGGRRDGEHTPRSDDDVMSKVVEARNQEINNVYSQISRPGP
jgi:hypothetical protein